MSKPFIAHDVSKQMGKQTFKLFMKKNIFNKKKKIVKSITYIFE